LPSGRAKEKSSTASSLFRGAVPIYTSNQQNETESCMDIQEFRGYAKYGHFSLDKFKVDDFNVSAKRTLLPLLLEARHCHEVRNPKLLDLETIPTAKSPEQTGTQ